MRPRCESCKHWQPTSPTDYRAPCALGYGQPAFDDGCKAHAPMDAAAPDMALQSASRGMTYQEWVRKMMGKQ